MKINEMKLEDVLDKMATAIKDFEGWFPTSRSFRNKNPGNLVFHKQKGATGPDKDGFAVFISFDDGWNALINQLRIAFTGKSKVYKPTMNLLQFFQKYTKDDPSTAVNEEIEYANFVADRFGVTVGTKLKELIS